MTSQQAFEIRTMHPTDLEHIILIEREIFLFPWSPGNFSDSLKRTIYARSWNKRHDRRVWNHDDES